MKNVQEASFKKKKKDTYDSYFDCITTCYRLGKEDTQCMTKCVEVFIEKDLK